MLRMAGKPLSQSSTMNELVTTDNISRLICFFRNERVILDKDLAKIYGVETRVLNQAVKRNRDRFPTDFVFQLTAEEALESLRLRSQNVILKPGRGSHRKYRPFAFTEHGALMSGTVLNSVEAVKMSLFIIRAFVKMREDIAANAAILKRLAEIDKTLLLHDAGLRDIYQKLRPLLVPPPEPPKNPKLVFTLKRTLCLTGSKEGPPRGTARIPEAQLVAVCKNRNATTE